MQRPSHRHRLVLSAAIVLLAAGALLLAVGLASLRRGEPAPAAPAAEPLLPAPPTGSPPARAATPLALPAAASDRAALPGRLGVGVPGGPLTAGLADLLGLGWYLDWAARPEAFRSPAVEYVPMLRLRSGQLEPSGEALAAAVRAHPGALWLVGNEPDVVWQDNVAPERYAELYHEAYTRLKALDPTCRVAVGGVSQPTPLRLRYLDRVLAAYRRAYGAGMPVDVWNVHNFLLREERGSWGVDIPPGLDDGAGVLREVADHADLALFRAQVLDFRRWMAERGQRDKPLIVSEYGILMPAEYGFPPEQVSAFLRATSDFFLTARDPDTGYPADDNRLVQRWCWFSLDDRLYPTGNLLAPGGALTPLGEAFRAYAHSLP